MTTTTKTARVGCRVDFGQRMARLAREAEQTRQMRAQTRTYLTGR